MNKTCRSILILTNLFPNIKEPGRGVFVKQEVDELKRNADVAVIAPVPFNPFSVSSVPNHEMVDGVAVYHPRWIVIPKIGRFLYGFLLFLSIHNIVKKTIRQHKSEVLYALWAYPDGFAAVLLSFLFRKPVFIHALGCDINLYTKYFFRRQLIRWALCRATGIISVSCALRDSMVALGIPLSRITVIPNGVDTRVFNSIPRGDARVLLKLAPSDKIILFVGRLEEEKGVEYLIRAVADIFRTNEMPMLKLYIAGEGVLRKELETLAFDCGCSQRIIFVGAIQHADVPKWLNAADVFCLPSIREGMPNVILESIACGTPVVASRVGGIPEIVDDASGLLVPPGDTQALSEALQSLLLRERSVASQNLGTRTWMNVAQEVSSVLFSSDYKKKT